MNVIKNIKMRWKLIFGFGSAIVYAVILTITAILSMEHIYKDYTYLLEYPQQQVMSLKAVDSSFANMRRAAFASVVYYSDKTLITRYQNQFAEHYNNAITAIDKYIELNNKDIYDNPQNNIKIENLRNELIAYKIQIVDEAMVYVLSGDIEEARNIHNNGAIVIIDNATSMIEDLLVISNDNMDEIINSVEATKNKLIIVLSIASAVIIILLVAAAIKITEMIVKPVMTLQKTAIEIAKGNLDVKSLEITKDEIGQLSGAFKNMAETFQRLLEDVSLMTIEREKGDLDYFIDSYKYQGDYKKLADNIFKLISTSHSDIMSFAGVIQEFAKGNFSADIPIMPGKKYLMNQIIDGIRDSMKSISNEISHLTEQAVSGNLSARANVSAYSGDWKQTIEGINILLGAFSEPINEVIQVLDEIYKGNFSVCMTGDYKGDFFLIKKSLNTTVTNISGYINEISQILNEIANNNLDEEIKREYIGQFASIKDSLNNIINKLNNVITDINASAEQVSIGAKQFSESSMMLANGAAEQAASIDDLNAKVTAVNEKTTATAANAAKARELSNTTSTNANAGNRDMLRMLDAMKEIKESSNNIYKIIKTIDDIAFQTNLLALNAAVEAARAGIHGKGFSVVAEEVRNLAGKSKIAAQETADMIENSISKVNEGMDIAVQTASNLSKIVTEVSAVSGIVSEIASSSAQQAEAIAKINIGVDQISRVIQSNASASQESASGSEELFSQSELLKNMTKKFKIRKK